MAKEKELIERNIELSTEFSRYIFEHPELETIIPLGAEILFLPDFDPELKNYNLELGKKLEVNGTKIFYVRITRLRPKVFSRIEEISLGENITGRT